MSARSSNRHKIADKLFYGIIILLVLALGGLGTLIIHQRMTDTGRKMEKRIEAAANYLERALPLSVFHLNAKQIRNDIEGTASDELQAVEIFDTDGERTYVYERTRGVVYDRKIGRDLIYGGNRVGKMTAYFAAGSLMRSLRIREFLRLIILISAAGLVLGFGLYLLVRRIIISPIDDTLAFSKELAGGNYGKRIDITSGDEMGLLQEALNEMADALQESVENLKASFYEAEGAHRQALEASRLKSEFLANISHEIRTPINAITGFTDLLLESERNSEKCEALRSIKKSVGILLEHINEILDFSKLEAGKLKISKTEFLLRDIVDEIAPIIKLRLHGKAVKFTVEVADEVSEVISCDRIRLRQVLLNIIINSTKFTHQGEIILSVSHAEDDSALLFKVADTGIGIPKEYHDRIFEPFTQADGSITREYGGTGLGLAIAKRIIEMMNGQIWFESQPTKGTTFWFTIPV